MYIQPTTETDQQPGHEPQSFILQIDTVILRIIYIGLGFALALPGVIGLLGPYLTPADNIPAWIDQPQTSDQQVSDSVGLLQERPALPNYEQLIDERLTTLAPLFAVALLVGALIVIVNALKLRITTSGLVVVAYTQEEDLS